MLGTCTKLALKTFTCVIIACANALSYRYTLIQVFGLIISQGFYMRIEDCAYALVITFYASCERIEDSLKVFDEKAHEKIVV